MDRKKKSILLLLALCSKLSIAYEDVGEPLFLTPLIDEGKIIEAQNKSFVQHDEMKNVISYAGFLTVNKLYNSNIFFWYFPSEENSTDPVLLWLNGGPGTSSMLGLFNENGPFVVRQNKSLELRQYSWHKNHHLIYADIPIDAGFSFTEDERGLPNNNEDMNRDMLEMLVQFFKLFPDLRGNDFYISGESYSGKTVPFFAEAVNKHNAMHEPKINLKGLSIGNGLIDPRSQIIYAEPYYFMGLINREQREQLQKLENELRGYFERQNYKEANRLIFKIKKFNFNLTGFTYYMNLLQHKEPSDYNFYADYLQKADVRKALHVGELSYRQKSANVLSRLEHELSLSASSALANLLDYYRVLIYHGQLDIHLPYAETEKFIENFAWSGADSYRNATRKMWWLGDQLAGYYRSANNLNFVMVRNSGHLVPGDQPAWAWCLITSFTRHLTLQQSSFNHT